LFAGLAREAQVRSHDEGHAGRLDARGERVELLGRKHDAKMRHRDRVCVDVVKVVDAAVRR
jgi:hypothetical protein